MENSDHLSQKGHDEEMNITPDSKVDVSVDTAKDSGIQTQDEPPTEDVITDSTMTREMLIQVLAICKMAMEETSNQKRQCEILKNDLDAEFEPDWQVIVGNDFCTSVTTLDGTMAFLYSGGIAFFIFKKE